HQPPNRRRDAPRREDGQELRVEPPRQAGHGAADAGGSLRRSARHLRDLRPWSSPSRVAHTQGMTTILVLYHTSEGQTARIADHIAAVLRDLGDQVEAHDVAGAPAPERYDGVVVGDSIHAVHHSKALTRYLQDHVAVLNKLPAAL